PDVGCHQAAGCDDQSDGCSRHRRQEELRRTPSIMVLSSLPDNASETDVTCGCIDRLGMARGAQQAAAQDLRLEGVRACPRPNRRRCRTAISSRLGFARDLDRSWLIAADPTVDRATDDGAYDRSNPEQPELLESPAADEQSGAGAARRI